MLSIANAVGREMTSSAARISAWRLGCIKPFSAFVVFSMTAE
jgi:hypothetical protein